MTTNAPAEAIPAGVFYDAMIEIGVTDVVAVPDTHVKTLIRVLQDSDQMRFIQTATEDEALCVAAGLIIGGRKPLVQIQHAGLYASANHLRGVAIDGSFPIVMMIGLLDRDPAKPPTEDFGSLNRYVEPLLKAFDVPYFLIDHVDQVPQMAEAYRLAEERRGPVAVLIGEATS